ncbi:hypothetical protein ACHAXA_006711 [Cyclostephanos tholiformis]|uniref:Glycosyltransferase 2-like domain-containing protein n=1 Tax=Cyclostephanos tholiformis TaxID=382380 RepID=A0ABD3SS22_9STRA
MILKNPGGAIQEWASSGGIDEVVHLARNHNLICDGWISLLPFLPVSELKEVKRRAKTWNVEIKFVATSRDVEDTVNSELHHWVLHDLERRAGLSSDERKELDTNLRARAYLHRQRILCLSGLVTLLPLAGNIYETWPNYLRSVSMISAENWCNALARVGVCNSNPSLPVEGILLTMRLVGNAANEKVEKLLSCMEEDKLCKYLLVLGIDEDELDTDAACVLIKQLQSRAELKQQMQSFHIVTNPSQPLGHPFAVCKAWDSMAVKAWSNGADWVLLLGDDIEIDCPFHYRAFYRCFLDISHRLGVPFGFGCPFWNDCSFPGFPSFPCIGRVHHDIFQALIPKHRQESFVNQDFDPYIHTLYAKLKASPCVKAASLKNSIGGNMNPRYDKVPAQGWQDFVLDDFRNYIRPCVPKGTPENVLLDVIVPSFRVQVDYLQSICSLKVPKKVTTNFIVIIDNKEALLRVASDLSDCRNDISVSEAEGILEHYLAKAGNTIRVRCNKFNLGASASRNRGLDESAAEYVLNLDDDLVPDDDLLEQYGRKLMEIDETVVGLVGLVRFPRSPDIPLRHAAVLMSNLTYMFEIAERSEMHNPAWGVTANILFRRTNVRFDLIYAKTGGGEDVDYALRVTEASGGGTLLSVPQARVVHPFWPGSIFTLASHFYNWSIGDGALFKRFPQHCYWSFPNLPETILLTLLARMLVGIGLWDYLQFIIHSFVADFLVDLIFGDYKHRISVVHGIGKDQATTKRSHFFYLVAHVLANLYVVGLECGRLRGHIGRLDIRYGVFRRFDWHIGRLDGAPSNFRKREAQKFCLFVAFFIHLVRKL